MSMIDRLTTPGVRTDLDLKRRVLRTTRRELACNVRLDERASVGILTLVIGADEPVAQELADVATPAA